MFTDTVGRLIRPFILLVLVGVTTYMAVFMEVKEAQSALLVQFVALAGATWGERSALKTKDDERQERGTM